MENSEHSRTQQPQHYQNNNNLAPYQQQDNGEQEME